MTLEELQDYLDVEKWVESEKIKSDMCGKYARCLYCNRYVEYPCARAYERFMEEQNGENPKTITDTFIPEPPVAEKIDVEVVMEVAKPVEETTEGIVEEGAKPVEETTEGNAEEVAKSVEETTEGNAEEVVKPVEETTEGNAEEVAKPVEETTEGNAEEGAKPVDETTEGIVEEEVAVADEAKNFVNAKVFKVVAKSSSKKIEKKQARSGNYFEYSEGNSEKVTLFKASKK